MKCVNLKNAFGKKYRIALEEPNMRSDDPWVQIIPCRYGHIFPHGGKLLAASVDGHPGVAGRLRKLRCCRVHQDGDFGELTVVFDIADFEKVAKVMRPRQRRQTNLTPEQRADIGSRLRRAKERRQATVQIDRTARQCVGTGWDDPEHVQGHSDAKSTAGRGV